MATLTDADFTQMKRIAHQSGNYDTLAALGLSKATYKAILQACENYFVNAFSAAPSTSYKAAVEAVAGSLTNPQAIAIFDVWVIWKRGTLQ